MRENKKTRDIGQLQTHKSWGRGATRQGPGCTLLKDVVENPNRGSKSRVDKRIAQAQHQNGSPEKQLALIESLDHVAEKERLRLESSEVQTQAKVIDGYQGCGNGPITQPMLVVIQIQGSNGK